MYIKQKNTFQVVLGMAFDAKVEILTEFTSDPDDPKLTAKACFSAAIVYACFLGFCGCQVKHVQKDMSYRNHNLLCLR